MDDDSDDYNQRKSLDFNKGDFEKLEKLRAYESKSWTMASVVSSRVIAPYIQTVRKTKVNVPMPIISARISDAFEIRSDLWDSNVFQTLKTSLLNQKQLLTALLEAADRLKTITSSDIALVYIVDPETTCIYRITQDVEKKEDLQCWKIGCGTVLAAYVAEVNEFVITDDLYCDTRFPKALECNDVFVHCAMAVPVAAPNKKVKVVLEFARTTQTNIYTWNDLNSVIASANWIGHAIFNFELSNLKQKHTSIIKFVMKTVSKYSTSYETALIEIMVLFKYILSAEKAAFFVISTEDSRHMYADFYEEIRENSFVVVKKRVLITEDDLAVGKAAFTQQIVNIKDKAHEAQKDIKYVSPVIRNTLCLPIKRDAVTVGVLQLINKKTRPYFNKEDEVMIQNYSDCFLIVLNFISMTRNVERRDCELTISKELLNTHFKACKHDEEEIGKKLDSIPENFMTLTWYPTREDLNKLPQLSLIMFIEALGDNFMKRNNVADFILTVQKFYRQNPYHNFFHAFMSAHTMAYIICQNQHLFSKTEKSALMIASFCHDLDHRGYTNTFIEITKHPLSYLYETSILENHHFSISKKIMEVCKICEYLNSTEYCKLLQEIHECILASDLSNYFTSRTLLVEKLKNNTFTWTNNDNRRYVKNLLMTACDHSLLTHPYSLSKKVTESIYIEFYNQGDMEKKMGLIPQPIMDRKKEDNIPEYQVQFLNSVIMPCCYVLAKLIPTTVTLFKGCRNLRRQWCEQMKLSGKDIWFPDKSYVDDM